MPIIPDSNDVFLQEEEQAVPASVRTGVTRPAKRNAARASDAPSQPPAAPMPLQAEHEALQAQQALPSRFCTGDVFLQKGDMKRVTRTAPVTTDSRCAEVLELDDNFPLSCGNDVFLQGEMKRASLKSSAPHNSAPVVPAAPSKGSKINSGGNVTKLIFFLIMIPAIYFFSGTGNSN